MALVVEDGTGKSDAESYLSVADTDTYLTQTATLDTSRATLKKAWNAAAPAVQEAALREATRYIESNYLARFTGDKGTKAQALSWPRTSAVDAYGWAIDTNVIPQALQDATAELALRALSATVAPDISAGSGSLTAKTVAAGSVRLEQQWSAGGARERATYDRVEELLRPLLTGGGGTGVIELKRA